jgi:hypothetical protein
MGWGFLWGESSDSTDLPPCPGLNTGECSAGSVGGQINQNATCPPCTKKVRRWKCEYNTNPPLCCSYYTCEATSTAGTTKDNPCKGIA